MPELIPTALVAVIVALFAAALWTMTAGRLTVAGLCFLSASLLIYLRERWLRRSRAATE
jgi:membrane protein implicated in regulation of membrane protease activity